MATTSLLAFQKAIYDRISGDATIIALISGVYDYPDEEQTFPFITIGSLNSVDFSTHTYNGLEYDLDVHVWSRKTGKKECKDIMDNVYRLFHNYVLTVTGFTHVITWFKFEDIERDPDGKTYHGIVSFKAIVN